MVAAALAAAGCSEQPSEQPGANSAAGEREAAADRASLPELTGRVIRVGCRQSECAWMRVVRLERVADRADGELRRLVARPGRSLYRWDAEPTEAWSDTETEWAPSDASSYAFCSTRRPAYAFPGEDGRLILHRLDLFELAGYDTASAEMYMRVCHDRDFPHENSAALEALGYRPGTASGQEEGVRPEDIAGS